MKNNSSGKNNSTGKRTWAVIMKRELAAYFTSPIAYIVTALFLIFSGLVFFSTFFIVKRAELRNFFEMLPIFLSFFIPALTMRVFSDEKRTGTMETLVTLPVKVTDIVAGKYLASFVSGISLLVPTLFYAVTCAVFGSPDAGPVIGGYLGAVFLIAAFSAIGVFASSVTKNQIIAFFLAFALCIALTMISSFSIFLPGPVVKLVSFISASGHFLSVSRGIVDSRDVLYFVSLTALFIAMTVRTIRNERKN